MNAHDHLPICNACGTQYADTGVKRCRICDRIILTDFCKDPRQFVPPSGQSWTTLAELREEHHNIFEQDPVEKSVWSIYSEPSFGIGQRALLIDTPQGNVLWDLIALLDQDTVDFIKSVGTGKLNAIVISHPHFYTTNRVWSEVFDCPVYVASDDIDWLSTSPDISGDKLKQCHETNTQILQGVTAIKCGGHFPGSMCLHYQNMLFVADTFMTVRSARNPEEHIFEGTHAYSFMWSIPNMIPLDPKTIYQIWSRVKPFTFDTTYGNIPGLDVRSKDVKARLLKSAKIQVRNMGWEGKEEGDQILREQVN